MAIRLLPPDVSSKIAAGEVTERPASVVKELVENSLDAGATEVSIEIRGGGVEYIRVADNGSGIASDEVELAFQRFATSKLADARDLESISNLGFRGEALPSIAAVSAVSLVTRGPDDDSGTRVDVANGEIVGHKPQGASQGTSVTVRHLFRDLPARRKFLRSTATETSRVQVLVSRYGMAYPEVRFQLDVEGSTAFSSSGSGDLREAISAVYGLEVAQAMLEIAPEARREEGSEPIVWGMMSPPSVSRANRSYTSLFVNRRFVQNRMLGYALAQAYHGFLMERRHPLAVVNVTLPYQDVDVNVHPAKTEVRFLRENQVFGALQQAVRHTLTTHSPVPGFRHAQVKHTDSTSRPRSAPFWPIEPLAAASAPPIAPDRTHHSPPHSEPSVPVPKKALPALRVLGQVQNTYIVAEGPEGMYLIDQHAAHERVVFEKVRAGAVARTSETQTLLEPVTIDLNARQRELVEAHHELISRFGFHFEPFGDQAYLLRGVPGLLAEGAPAQALLDVLDSMEEGGGFESWEERAAYSIACHGAIRAGKTLSHQEMEELTRQLEECQQANTCPHGRPTMVHLSSSNLEREFGRR